MSLQITQVVTPKEVYNIKCPYVMTASSIVVHDTANDASAMAEISYMLSNVNYTSFHFAVDDYRAVQGLPLDRNGWHAGDGTNGTGNRLGIGIEVCYSKSGGERYLKARENAAELCAILLKARGWGVNKITKHQDYSGKYCPHRNLDMGWNNFIALVKTKLDALNGKKPTPAPQPTKIAVGDTVKVTGTSYATGGSIPAWVKDATHKVSQIKDDRALLGAPNGIMSWVLIKDIEKVAK